MSSTRSHRVTVRAESKKRTADGLSKTQSNTKRQDVEEVLNPSTLLTISEHHKADLRRAFDMFDRAGTGRIMAHEVKVALYALGYDVTNDELNQLLHSVGASASDDMDFNDFYNVLFRKMTQREPRVESIRAFRQVDEDEKGYISLEDLRAIAKSLNINLTDDELMEMVLFAHPTSTSGGAVAEFDAKDVLSVSEEEFLRLLRKANVY